MSGRGRPGFLSGRAERGQRPNQPAPVDGPQWLTTVAIWPRRRSVTERRKPLPRLLEVDHDPRRKPGWAVVRCGLLLRRAIDRTTGGRRLDRNRAARAARLSGPSAESTTRVRNRDGDRLIHLGDRPCGDGHQQARGGQQCVGDHLRESSTSGSGCDMVTPWCTPAYCSSMQLLHAYGDRRCWIAAPYPAGAPCAVDRLAARQPSALVLLTVATGAVTGPARSASGRSRVHRALHRLRRLRRPRRVLSAQWPRWESGFLLLAPVIAGSCLRTGLCTDSRLRRGVWCRR